jgi:hypothetical protein
MVIVKLRDGKDWYRANWIFRQLAQDVMATFSRDKDLALEMEKAQAFGALYLDSMEEERARKIFCAIKEVVAQTLEGKIQGWKGTKPSDVEGHRMYAESISDLMKLLKKEESGGNDTR